MRKLPRGPAMSHLIHKFRCGWQGAIVNNRRHSDHSENVKDFWNYVPETRNKDLTYYPWDCSLGWLWPRENYYSDPAWLTSLGRKRPCSLHLVQWNIPTQGPEPYAERSSSTCLCAANQPNHTQKLWCLLLSHPSIDETVDDSSHQPTRHPQP